MGPPAVEWDKTYFPGYWSTFRSISETTDGGYVATITVSSDTKYSLYRLSFDGAVLWSARSDLDNQGGIIAEELLDGSFIVAGFGKETPSSSTALMIAKYDSAGQEIWTKLYNSSYPGSEIAHSLCVLPDSGFAICGEISPAEEMNQAWILRTDSQGDTLWTREWGWEAWDRARGILCLDSVITVLCSGRLEGDPGCTYIVRYNLDGDLLSQYRIPEMEGEYGFDMCEASDDGLLIVDNYNPLIVHTDYYGYFDWSIWAPGLGQPYGWSIDSTMDGGFIYGGENKADEIWDACGMISRHNADGTELWRDYVYNSGCLCIYSAHQLSQGGYIVAGYANPSSTDGHQGFLMKYAPELGIEESDPSNALHLDISPNPCSSVLSVSFVLPESGKASVQVYDLSGRLVDTVADGLFPAGDNTVEWTVPQDVSSGCYLVQYSSGLGFRTESVFLIE